MDGDSSSRHDLATNILLGLLPVCSFRRKSIKESLPGSCEVALDQQSSNAVPGGEINNVAARFVSRFSHHQAVDTILAWNANPAAGSGLRLPLSRRSRRSITSMLNKPLTQMLGFPLAAVLDRRQQRQGQSRLCREPYQQKILTE